MREGSPWVALIGVPGIIAIFAFIAFAKESLLVAVIAVPVVLLVIGFAMAIAKKSG